MNVLGKGKVSWLHLTIELEAILGNCHKHYFLYMLVCFLMHKILQFLTVCDILLRSNQNVWFNILQFCVDNIPHFMYMCNCCLCLVCSDCVKTNTVLLLVFMSYVTIYFVSSLHILPISFINLKC